jgi:hypothetical protein
MSSDSPLRRAWRLLKISVRRPIVSHPRQNVWVLVVGVLAICGWQFAFSANSATLDARYRNLAASGVHDDVKFVYFLYYLKLFPLATTRQNPPLDAQGALALLREHPSSLVQDFNWTWSEGDRGKIYLYLFDAWLKGEPREPSVKPFNRLGFTLALCSLFGSFWWVGQPLLGGLAVAFLGSNPFQLYEVHARENVHGWTITTAILVLALYLPTLGRRAVDRRYLWILPVVTGALLATVRTIRSEPISILVSAALACLVLRDISWQRRGLMIAALAGSFALGNAGWSRWFDYKHAEVTALLTRIGGHPFPGPVRAHHALWHPIWCGLGDFGQKYGYSWRDEDALAYAAPILESRYHQTLPKLAWNSDLPRDEYWDDQKIYKKLPFDVPHYAEVLRGKILRDITHDPLWFAGVVARRAWRILFDATPVRLAWAATAWTLPMHGLALLPLMALLVAARSRLLLSVILFTLPTCMPAMVVYSGGGMIYYGIYHLFVGAVLSALVIQNSWWWVSRGWGIRPRRPT